MNKFDHLNILRKGLLGLLVLFKTFEILEKSHSVLAMDILLTFFNGVFFNYPSYIYIMSVCVRTPGSVRMFRKWTLDMWNYNENVVPYKFKGVTWKGSSRIIELLTVRRDISTIYVKTSLQYFIRSNWIH